MNLGYLDAVPSWQAIVFLTGDPYIILSSFMRIGGRGGRHEGHEVRGPYNVTVSPADNELHLDALKLVPTNENICLFPFVCQRDTIL